MKVNHITVLNDSKFLVLSVYPDCLGARAAQRSAQELPLVEKQSTDSYPVIGGKKMVLSGHNFLQDSKVIFVEKAPGMFFRLARMRSCAQCWWELAPGWQDMDPPPA